MNLFNLSAIISLDKKGFDDGVKAVNKEGEGLSKKLSAWTVAAGHLIANYAEKAVSKVVSIGKEALTLSGELEQQMGGVKAVFKETYGYIEDAADTAYKHLGLSKAQYLAEANKMGSLLKGMGFQEAKAAEMTMNWMQRAADVASIMGISTADAMTAIEGAAKGNFSMMDNLGVAMNATTLEAYRLSKGIKTSYNEMTQAQKIGLAYDLFMEKTANYAGNFTKENKTFAGSLAVVQAAWENLISGSWLYAETAEQQKAQQEEAINGFSDAVANAFDQVLDLAGKLFPSIWDSLKKAAPKILPKVTKLISGFIKDLPKTLSSVLTGAANGAIDIINAIFGTKFPHIKDIKLPTWKDLQSKANAIINDINKFFGTNIPEIGSVDFPSLSLIVVKARQWWKNNDIAKAIQDTCSWAIGIFTSPEENISAEKVGQILGQWWNVAKTALKTFCTWAIGLFGMPTEEITPENVGQILGQWWATAKEALKTACTWVLGVFGTPTDELTAESAATILGQWWTTAKEALKTACTWVIGIFDSVDETGGTAEGKVGGWWATVVQDVTDACQWTLKLFGMPQDSDAINAISGFLQRTVAATGAGFKWAVSLPGKPPEKSANDLGKIVGGWIEAGVTAIYGAMSLPELNASNMSDEAKDIATIQEWWDTKIVPGLNLVLNFTLGLMGYDSIESFAADMERRMTIALANLADALGLSGVLGLDTDKMRQNAQGRYDWMKEHDWRYISEEDYEKGNFAHYEERQQTEEAKAEGDAAYQDALNAPKRILDETKAAVAETASQGVDAFAALIDKMTLTNGGQYKDKNGETLYNTIASKVEGFEEIMDEIDAGTKSIEDIDADMRNRIMEAAGIEVESMNSATNAAKETEAELLKLDQMVVTPTVMLQKVGFESVTAGGVTLTPNAKGLDYVPYDDYLTALHKGEAVLSGNEAREWRESGGRGQGYGDASAIVTAIQGLSNDLQNLRLFVGERAFAGAVVDYSGRQMNTYLGSSSTRRRTGYGRR